MARAVVANEVQQMFGSIAARYDLTNTVLSFGMDSWWRWRFVRLPKRESLRVLDLCTGTADLIEPLRKRFGFAIGVDFCFPMLAAGKSKVASTEDKTAPLLQGDALKLPFSDKSFDLVTVAFGVRNFENLDAGLLEARRVLSDGGSLAILEFGQPSNGLWGKSFEVYSRYVMPAIGSFITGNRDAYEYLPETSRAFPCGERFNGILQTHGFTPQRTVALSGGIAYMYLAKKSG